MRIQSLVPRSKSAPYIRESRAPDFLFLQPSRLLIILAFSPPSSSLNSTRTSPPFPPIDLLTSHLLFLATELVICLRPPASTLVPLSVVFRTQWLKRRSASRATCPGLPMLLSSPRPTRNWRQSGRLLRRLVSPRPPMSCKLALSQLVVMGIARVNHRLRRLQTHG